MTATGLFKCHLNINAERGQVYIRGTMFWCFFLLTLSSFVIYFLHFFFIIFLVSQFFFSIIFPFVIFIFNLFLYIFQFAIFCDYFSCFAFFIYFFSSFAIFGFRSLWQISFVFNEMERFLRGTNTHTCIPLFVVESVKIHLAKEMN